LITKFKSKIGEDCTKYGRNKIPKHYSTFPKDILILKLRVRDEISEHTKTPKEFDTAKSRGKGNVLRNMDINVVWCAAPCGF
jgi:hypothetical protein